MADTLRDAIQKSGKSIREIAAKSGIDSGRISRFVRKERDLTFAAAEKICVALGLELTEQKMAKNQSKKDDKTA